MCVCVCLRSHLAQAVLAQDSLVQSVCVAWVTAPCYPPTTDALRCACMAKGRRNGQKAAPANGAWMTVLSAADQGRAKAAEKELAKFQAQAKKSQGAGAGSGGGTGNAAAPASHGMKPLRPLKAGDAPPGVLTYDATRPTWCELSWHGQRYRCNTAFGGWTCTVCAMPTNRSDRTHCCVCGAKPKSGCPTVDPAPTSTAPAPQAAAGTGGASSTPSESEEEVMDLTEKCVALAFNLPSLDEDIAALSWPSEQNEPLTGKGRFPAAEAAALKLAAAKEALIVAQSLAQMMASSALQSKETQLQLAKEVDAQTANVAAAQKAVDATPSASTKTPKQLLLNAQGRLSNTSESFISWHTAATARKVASELSMTTVANRYSELAAALMAEKQKYLDQARLCVAAWDVKNSSIDARMKADIAAVEQEVRSLTPPPTVPTSPPPAPTPLVAAPVPVSPPLPPLQPLTQLPPMELPDDQDYLRTLASMRLALHVLHDQEEEVRSSYPVTFAHLIAHGITWDKLTHLLPSAIIGTTAPATETTIAWRLLGALRRRLDGLATLWDVQNAKLSTESDVLSRSHAFTTGVLEQANGKRQRVAPADSSGQSASSAAPAPAEAPASSSETAIACAPSAAAPAEAPAEEPAIEPAVDMNTTA